MTVGVPTGAKGWGPSFRLALVAALAGVGGVLGLACSTNKDIITGPAASLHSIAVTPDTTTLVTGSSQSLTAQPKDASGNTLSGIVLAWASSDTTVATVTQSGAVTARKAGTAQIAASAYGVNGLATVTVIQVPVAEVHVAPSGVVARVGTTVQLSDTLEDASGNVLPGRPVTWATDNAAVASVDQTGLVTARATGVAHISANVPASTGQAAVSGQATVTVTLIPVAAITISATTTSVFVGQTIQLLGIPTDSTGAPLIGRVVTWQSLNTGVATVSSTGIVTGVAPGSATIQATCEGKTATVGITVSKVPVSSVLLSPAVFSLLVNGTQQLTAQVTDAQGHVVQGAQVTYSVKNATATVSASGLVTAVNPGTDTIVGTSGGASGIAIVTISLEPVATVNVTPANDTLIVGAQGTLTATALGANGDTIRGRPVAWHSSNTAVATVSNAGVVTAVTTGTAVITATIGGQQGNATVVVNPIPVGSVTVAPKFDTIPAGGGRQQQLTVVVKDHNGNVINNPTVNWGSTNNGIAVVTTSGLVTGVAAGSAGIFASSGGIADTAQFVVYDPVATVTVTPTPDTIYASAPNNTVSLTATLKDSHGVTLTGRPLNWSSSRGIATVDGNGVVTGANIDSGTVTITATSPDPGSPSGSATVVVFGHVTTITVTPGNTTLSFTGLTDSTSKTETARLVDSFGNDVTTERPLTWTTSDPATVEINGSTSSSVSVPPNSPVRLTAVSTNSSTVTITVTTPDGATTMLAITVSG